MEVRPRLQESGVHQVGALPGGLQPPSCRSLSRRSPRHSGHQVRDALQPFPVYVVFLRLFLPFPVFKVSFFPVGVALDWPRPAFARGSLRVLWMPLGAWPPPGWEWQPGQKAPRSLWMGQELFGRPGLQAGAEAI